MKKLLIVDGNSILNRAFYGIRPLTTKEGIPTNAVYGFVNILKKHTDAISPDYLACAFDLKAPTFRHKMFDGYKANRKGMPDDLAAQLPIAKEAAKNMGFHVMTCEGWEADDILGTVSGMGDKDGNVHSYILTGDRDSLQLITETTSVVLVKTKEDIVYTPERFAEEYGITPDQFVHVKALMGDTSDNIPGVMGIGEKTALKLISTSGSLDELYADDNLGGAGKSAKEKLLAGKDSAYMSYDLAKISREAPVGVELDELEATPDNKALSELFVRLEFSALLKRFGLEEESTPSPEIEMPVLSEEGIEALGDNVAVSAKDKKIFATDGKIRVCVDIEDSKSILEKGVICHDYKKLCIACAPYGIEPKCLFDTMTAAYLLSPGESSYPMSKLALRYLSATAADDGEEWYCHLVYPLIKEEIEKEGMADLLYKIEIPLSPVLASMEVIGFRLDAEGLHGYIESLTDLMKQTEQRIYMFAGKEFNLNSPKQLGEVLFEEMGLPVQKKTKTGYATDAETLSKLRNANPIVEDILFYRQVAKLVGTYGENLIALCDENGRIHTSFNQTGTATGRLSSVDPNLQNIPIRTDLGRELRRFFVAKNDDYVLLDADYSQIELRLLAEISGDETMREAFVKGEDIHSSTASKVFGIPLEAVTKQLRSRAKAVNFGIVYGIGDFSLAQDIGVSRKAAREYIDNYLATYTKVDEYLNNTKAEAREKGYTVTMFGRRRPIPELSAKNKNLQAFGERVAMNSPIQGSAADIIKIAMIDVYKALEESGIDAKLILQVHDELIIECNKNCVDKASEILRECMEHAVKTTVPLTADVSVGANWLDAK
ncbi:MAG: DNA polymerase I [Clostridia bacterium]|nr:DNA polymerase I [Clostridia bacterium]